MPPASTEKRNGSATTAAEREQARAAAQDQRRAPRPRRAPRRRRPRPRAWWWRRCSIWVELPQLGDQQQRRQHERAGDRRAPARAPRGEQRRGGEQGVEDEAGARERVAGGEGEDHPAGPSSAQQLGGADGLVAALEVDAQPVDARRRRRAGRGAAVPAEAAWRYCVDATVTITNSVRPRGARRRSTTVERVVDRRPDPEVRVAGAPAGA